MASYISITTIAQDPNVNWKSIASELKQQVRLTKCSHFSEKTNKLVEHYGCGRRKSEDDLCMFPSSNEKACIAWLSVRFDLGNETAKKLLHHLRDLGWISIYECDAVFFHD